MSRVLVINHLRNVSVRGGVDDCAELPLEDDAVDLVFCSPPYEDARDYGIGYKLKGQAWVDWCVPRFMECLRVSKGLVAWVVSDKTVSYRWTAATALLMADLHRAGVRLRRPALYTKPSGVPGSGGPDWLANRYEFVVCATREKGRLPWSDNTACGHEPKHPVGGAMSNRHQDGSRRDKRTGKRLGKYRKPKLANPGNVIQCAVGGGLMGHKLAHEGEAPFSEKLAEFFVKSFCPPGGTVLDPFSGSGTTAAVAVKNGRNAIAFDIRESQIDLTTRRLRDVVLDEGMGV